MSTKGKLRAIIMDKAPEGDNLSMQETLGFTAPDYEVLAEAFNAEFGTSVTAADIEPLNTVGDVVAYMESIVLNRE